MAPPFPGRFRYLYVWALELHGRSGVGLGGVARVSHQEILAWADLMDSRPAPWEVRAIRGIDDALRGTKPPREKPKQRPPDPPWPEKGE